MAGSDLIDQVRRKLNVTYSHPSTDSRIEDDIIPSAEQDLRDLLGITGEFDFAQPGTENLLFLAHCYYEWNEALDDFEINYAGPINRCRQRWMVAQYAEEKEAAGLQ